MYRTLLNNLKILSEVEEDVYDIKIQRIVVLLWEPVVESKRREGGREHKLRGHEEGCESQGQGFTREMLQSTHANACQLRNDSILSFSPPLLYFVLIFLYLSFLLSFFVSFFPSLFVCLFLSFLFFFKLEVL